MDLGNAELVNISENAFRGKIQHTIKVLNLSSNSFDDIPSIQLSQLASLEELYMGGNLNIEEISENSLPDLRRLKLVDFSQSTNLGKISSHAFKDNANLEKTEVHPTFPHPYIQLIRRWLLHRIMARQNNKYCLNGIYISDNFKHKFN